MQDPVISTRAPIAIPLHTRVISLVFNWREARTLLNIFRSATTLFAACLYASTGLAALPPADAPAGTTAICKDGSYYFGQSKNDACKAHGGPKAWYTVPASGDAARAPSSPNPVLAARSVADAANAPPNVSTGPSRASVEAANASAQAAHPPANVPEYQDPAPGGRKGLVWVSDGRKVYRCEGDKLYGRTQPGKYMSEQDAKSKGLPSESGKACS